MIIGCFVFLAIIIVGILFLIGGGIVVALGGLIGLLFNPVTIGIIILILILGALSEVFSKPENFLGCLVFIGVIIYLIYLLIVKIADKV